MIQELDRRVDALRKASSSGHRPATAVLNNCSLASQCSKHTVPVVKRGARPIHRAQQAPPSRKRQERGSGSLHQSPRSLRVPAQSPCVSPQALLKLQEAETILASVTSLGTSRDTTVCHALNGLANTKLLHASGEPLKPEVRLVVVSSLLNCQLRAMCHAVLAFHVQCLFMACLVLSCHILRQT